MRRWPASPMRKVLNEVRAAHVDGSTDARGPGIDTCPVCVSSLFFFFLQSETSKKRDPSKQMKAYLSEQGRDLVFDSRNASRSVVDGSQVEQGIAITCRRFAQTEDRITNTALLVARMGEAVEELDNDVCSFVESVTLLEDVSEQLQQIAKEADGLFH